MKTIEICDEHYSKDRVYGFTRYAARAVILDGKKLLAEYCATPKIIMLPGGGVEIGESVAECAVRECKEECGLAVKPIKQLFAIREYYRDTVFFSTYVLCEIVGKCRTAYTQNEASLNMTCVWRDIDAAIKDTEDMIIKYKAEDGELLGMHRREYLALKEIAAIAQKE